MTNARPEVLLVSDGDKGDLKEILRRRANLTEAESIPEMLGLVASRKFDAVLCDWQLSEGTWREALQELQARRVATPAIVISQTCGVEEGIEEWTEVLEAGAFDLLLAPSQEYSVLTMMEHALVSNEARALRAAV